MDERLEIELIRFLMELLENEEAQNHPGRKDIEKKLDEIRSREYYEELESFFNTEKCSTNGKIVKTRKEVDIDRILNPEKFDQELLTIEVRLDSVFHCHHFILETDESNLRIEESIKRVSIDEGIVDKRSLSQDLTLLKAKQAVKNFKEWKIAFFEFLDSIHPTKENYLAFGIELQTIPASS